MSTRLAGYAARSTRFAEIDKALADDERLNESYQQMAAALMAMKADEEGWIPLTRLNDDDGFGLEAIQDISEAAELQTTGNPLLKRGLTLRTANVWGRGMTVEGTISQRVKDIMGTPANQSTLFSAEAFERNERAVFTSGNLIMAYRRSTRTFFPIPLGEITNSASNPDLTQDVWYYQRTYSKISLSTGEPDTDPTVEWYPVLEKFEQGVGKLRTTIASKRVDADVIVIDQKVNTRIGGVWGVPDCLPAMPYAWAHAEYLRDGSKLLKALATIAWKVTNKSKAGAQSAGVKMANVRGAGNTATMVDGQDITQVPRAGSVDLNEGSPLAGYVASALEVSKISLLSDPGAASGSYGAAAVLTPLEAGSARARQGLWTTFIKRCYRAAGAKNVTVNFPKLTEDPIFRQAQTLALLFTSGAIHQDEFRAAALEAADVPVLHTEVPEPSVFTTAAFQAEVNAASAAIDSSNTTNTVASPVPSQGNSGTVGALDDTSNTNRDLDAIPGTSSVQ